MPFIQGTPNNDILVGTPDGDWIVGGNGNDIIFGGNSSSLLQGDAGDDIIFGGDGNDWLIGGAGNDYLNGGAGNDILNGYGTTINNDSQFDTLYGGGGADTFVLGNADGAFYNETGDGYAVITDWSPGYDRIQAYGNSNQYNLVFTSVSGIGTAAQDTEIYYQGDRIGIVQDSTIVNQSNFQYV